MSISAAPDEVRATLRLLKEELFGAPQEESSAFLNALRVKPPQIDDQHLVDFLCAEGFDVKLAAERLMKYWMQRQRVFGEEKYALPLTLDGAMKDDVPALQSGFLTLLPTKDMKGRAVFYIDASKYRAVALSADQKIRVWWYIAHVAMADPKVTDAGFVILTNAKDYILADFLPKFAVSQCTSRFPIKWRAYHLCHCKTDVISVITPRLRAVMSEEQRETFFVHNGSDESIVQTLLRDHSFRMDCIPRVLGGDLEVSIESFIKERLMIEQEMAATKSARLSRKRLLASSTKDTANPRSQDETDFSKTAYPSYELGYGPKF